MTKKVSQKIPNILSLKPYNDLDNSTISDNSLLMPPVTQIGGSLEDIDRELNKISNIDEIVKRVKEELSKGDVQVGTKKVHYDFPDNVGSIHGIEKEKKEIKKTSDETIERTVQLFDAESDEKAKKSGKNVKIEDIYYSTTMRKNKEENKEDTKEGGGKSYNIFDYTISDIAEESDNNALYMTIMIIIIIILLFFENICEMVINTIRKIIIYISSIGEKIFNNCHE